MAMEGIELMRLFHYEQQNALMQSICSFLNIFVCFIASIIAIILHGDISAWPSLKGQIWHCLVARIVNDDGLHLQCYRYFGNHMR